MARKITIALTAALALLCVLTGCRSAAPVAETAPRPMPTDPAQAAIAEQYRRQAEAEHQAMEDRARKK